MPWNKMEIGKNNQKNFLFWNANTIVYNENPYAVKAIKWEPKDTDEYWLEKRLRARLPTEVQNAG